MALTGNRTFVGIGFGPVQAGLFLTETYRSGAFGRLVVAEIRQDVVDELRRAGGMFAVNIAHADHVEQLTIGPIEVFNPQVETDQDCIIEAIVSAEEIATAVPSVTHYVSPGPGSVHRLLSEGLRRKLREGGPPAVVYAAENAHGAAGSLEASVRQAMSNESGLEQSTRFVDTVIGKMGGAVEQAGDLVPVTPTAGSAFLVEVFNHILISRIGLEESGFRRGITVFEEKDDLRPFEEVKLYAHNATHAMAAYLAALAGAQAMSKIGDLPGAMTFLRAAMLEEAGAALLQKYRGLDPPFTPAGFNRYADDLLQRMVNPFLRDSVARVGRDAERKLGWNDRLIGAIRFMLRQRVEPTRYAIGAAAAVAALGRDGPVSQILSSLWESDRPAPEETNRVVTLVEDGQRRLRVWQASACGDWVG